MLFFENAKNVLSFNLKPQNRQQLMTFTDSLLH